MKKLVYLASPYSHDDQSVIERRVRQVQHATAILIEAGHIIFSPIVHTHPIAHLITFSPINIEGAMSGWMSYDEAMIDKADELWVLMLEGWELSLGVAHEIEYANEQGKPIRYVRYPEMYEEVELIAPREISFSFEAELTPSGNHILDSCNYAGWHSTGKPPLITEDARQIFDSTDQKIIGLHGHAQVGKDEIAKYLIERYNFERVSLADPLREALLALDPEIILNQFADPDLWRKYAVDKFVLSERGYYGYQKLSAIVHWLGWDEAKKIGNVRELLQRFGTEVGRKQFGENHWVDIAKKKIEAAYPSPVVVTDIRFENEAQMIRDLGGYVVHVTRQGVGAINSHPSDKKLDDSYLDFSIPNHGTIEDLHRAIRRALTEYIYEN